MAVIDWTADDDDCVNGGSESEDSTSEDGGGEMDDMMDFVIHRIDSKLTEICCYCYYYLCYHYCYYCWHCTSSRAHEMVASDCLQ